MELWHNMMFRALQKQPPTGCRFVSIQQVLSADKELFTIVEQASRGELNIDAGSPSPLDAFFEKYMNSSQDSYYMNPLPVGNQQIIASSGSKGDDPQAGLKSKGDPPKKGAGKGKGPHIAELLKTMPANYIRKMPDGKFLCLRYQNGQCFHQRKQRCNNGLHKCYYKGCHKDRPYSECNHGQMNAEAVHERIPDALPTPAVFIELCAGSAVLSAAAQKQGQNAPIGCKRAPS